jgi:hypothetical protein
MTRRLARWELDGVAGAVVVAYVITGRFEDCPDGGVDDVLAAELIERARTRRPLEARWRWNGPTGACDSSRVGRVEHLQLFPGDGDVADDAPSQAPA